LLEEGFVFRVPEMTREVILYGVNEHDAMDAARYHYFSTLKSVQVLREITNATATARGSYPGSARIMPEHIQSGTGSPAQAQEAGEGAAGLLPGRFGESAGHGCPPLIPGVGAAP
jgi:hypothetical protein